MRLNQKAMVVFLFQIGVLAGTRLGEVITQTINGSFRYPFNTCANTGSKGPTQYQCNRYYKEDLKVTVVENGALAGVQIWTVPETNLYSITALGASGGTGVQNPKASMGGYVNAKFNLTKGEEIYMLVGQQGESACSQTTKKKSKTEKICRHGVVLSEKEEENSTMVVVGGGGGGGGTFVFKRDPDTGESVPLIIAGGGGGKSYYMGHEPIRADGGLSPPGSGLNAYTPIDGPGGGAGWWGIMEGNSTQGGAVGGSPCRLAIDYFGWEINGGFGGGGGGCMAGGGGGGYTGGNVSLTNDKEHNGQGGSSYISPLGKNLVYEPATHTGEGEVEIAMVLPCPCEFMCIYQDYHKNKFKCYCQPNSILAEDGLHCLDKNKLKLIEENPEKLKPGIIFAIIISGLVFVVAMIACIIYAAKVVKRRGSQKHLKAMGLDVLSSAADYQLDRLRGQGMITEYNPNYDFAGTKCTLQDLREIPRDKLTLIKALGQGAFGEVYQGYLSNSPDGDIPVAVKTLPALCTDQAEMDFLMEALIMSKFSHPNIVQFMGVCFEKHPRFIILELLEGGDLKSFLRESRPKPDQPSSVTMLDLVKLSLDVAKGCQYLEEKHFIHRDIAARNCLLTTKGPTRVAKIADFGMARDIYRADYYRKGGKAMLPVKWMPPEAFLDGIFTSKTDTWSFGILLWEVFSLGYMPYPGRGNQEVMQLVTAGGRLEPPQNCPVPVYHVMTLCWHGIPERRPCFNVIIQRLQQCMQDPDVTHSPLPVFHRPPPYEKDTTIMRPKDPDRMVLTVEPPRRYLEPDSPNSMDQLIGPQSPDLDQLQTSQGAGSGRESTARRTEGLKSKPFYKKMFDYDLGAKPVTNRAAGEKRETGAQDTDQPGENDALIPPESNAPKPEVPRRVSLPSSLPQNSCNDAHSSSSNGDSGKSSLENLSSQEDSPSGHNLGISSAPTCPPSRASQHQAAAAIAAANIARSRPQTKRPFMENISLDRGPHSSGPKANKADYNKADSNNAQQTSSASSNKDASAMDQNSWSSPSASSSQPAPVTYENVPVTSSSGSATNSSPLYSGKCSSSSPASSSPCRPSAAATAVTPECDNGKDPGDSGVVIDLKNGSVLGKVERSNEDWL